MSQDNRAAQTLVPAAMIVIAAVVVFVFWTFGDPPPTSVFWRSADVEVVDVEVRARGVVNHYLRVTARTEAGIEGTADVRGRFQRDENGSIVFRVVDGQRQPVPDLAPGDRIPVRLGPGGRMTTEGPGGRLFGAILVTLIGGLMIAGAIVLLLRNFRQQER